MKTIYLVAVIVMPVTVTVFLTTVLMAIAGVEASAEEFRVPRSYVHTVDSEDPVLTYQVFVRTPRGYDEDYNKDRTYPVIYLNDGPYTFQVASGVTHIPEFDQYYGGVILVGISYALGENARASRTRDLTPAGSTARTTVAGRISGGAASYLNFLESRLMPFVETEYRVDPARRTLGGHSFGGLFAAWVLFRKPELFQNYIISSPSLWFDGKMMFDVEEDYAARHDDLNATVYLGTGQHEHVAPGQDLTGDHVAFVERLESRNYPNLILRSRILERIDHMTAFPINFTRASRWLFYSLDR